MMINYFETARENEVIFRLILDKNRFENKDLSLDALFKKYSEGDRMGVKTILDFEKKSPTIFEFTWENMAPFSGFGRTELWSFENGDLKFIETTKAWMS
jgi:hypothetical protein